MKSKWKVKIYYSQTWEDPEVLLAGLDVQEGESFVSITSGGCNTLALLLSRPKIIYSVDINPAQNYLLELKIAAMRLLGQEDYLKFIGILGSENRLEVYKKVTSQLTPDAQKWWGEHYADISKGIIHMGKFERYLSFFQRYLLPLVHTKKTIHRLFQIKHPEEQIKFYCEKWNTWRWRLLFKIFFSKTVLKMFGRNPSLFSHVKDMNVADDYLNRAKNAMSKDVSNNYFLQFIFEGNYRTNCLPLYLEQNNYEIIKSRLNAIHIYTGDLYSFFKSYPNFYDKFNLSNIFETASLNETNNMFKEIYQYASSSSKVVYINNLVLRVAPTDSFVEDAVLENVLQSKTRTFFYRKIRVARKYEK